MRRGGKSAGSFASNNLFVLAVTLLVFKDREGFAAISVLIAAILFFPLSADPLRKLPRARMAVWPIGRLERGLLRILSIALNPVAWVLAWLALRKAVTWELWAAVALLFAVAFAIPGRAGEGRPAWFRAMPHFPVALDQLIRNNLRQTFATLDFYCALAIAAGGFAFRCAGSLPPAAFLPMSLVVTMALSTYATNLFGLDGTTGMTRYRLLPIAAWQVLAAKDAAFLLVTIALTLALSPMAALAAAFVGLAYGHYASVAHRHADARWRFATSKGLAGGLLQMVAMALAGAAVIDGSPWALVPCAGLYAWSTWHWSRGFETA